MLFFVLESHSAPEGGSSGREISCIQLPEAIAGSAETIVRFEGDEYYRDFTIGAGDKAAIRQMLDVYEALR